MRIRFESGGGVTGPAGRRSCEIDTEHLAAPEAEQLNSLIKSLDLPGLANRTPPASKRPRPDEMYYEITVEENGRKQTISASDLDMPTGLRPLINWLAAQAVHCL